MVVLVWFKLDATLKLERSGPHYFTSTFRFGSWSAELSNIVNDWWTKYTFSEEFKYA